MAVRKIEVRKLWVWADRMPVKNKVGKVLCMQQIGNFVQRDGMYGLRGSIGGIYGAGHLR